jgi:hypothetical protein
MRFLSFFEAMWGVSSKSSARERESGNNVSALIFSLTVSTENSHLHSQCTKHCSLSTHKSSF